MFADAYEIASGFTKPVIVSTRLFDNSIDCGCGAYIILNDEGWIVTVAHLFNSSLAFQQHAKEIAEYRKQIAAIKGNPKLNAKQIRKKSNLLHTNPKWITNHSFWWCIDGVTVKDIVVLREADLAVCRLEPFDPASVPNYPKVKDPSNLRLGTSVCKLGYPFHEISASFDESSNRFTLAPGTLPIPRFPIEGIFTRNCVAGKSLDGKYDIKFLETSTPGLRGQSGGSIFDCKGTVWAVQSHTRHLPLGFSPKVKKKGKEIEENQFLNVGLGVHPELLVKFLDDNGIRFDRSDY